MIELFRERDSAIIGHYQSILESEGIKTFIRNEYGSNFTEIPIPVFFPALCIMNGEEKQIALDILKEYIQKSDDSVGDKENWLCRSCDEENPDNFEVCWKCNHDKIQQTGGR